MKTINKKILSGLDWIKSKSLIIYTEYLSAFFIIFGILFFIFLIAYYLHLLITSPKKDKLSNMTTIFSFIFGFLIIKYQINNKFMTKEKENILKITNQLKYVQKKGKEIEQEVDTYIRSYNNKIAKNKQLNQLRKIEELISEQLKICDKATQLIQDNLNIINFRIRYSKISLLTKRLTEVERNIMIYELNLFDVSTPVFNLENHILSLKENGDKTPNNEMSSLESSYIQTLKKASKNVKLYLKSENDANSIYRFLQKYDK